MLPLDCLIPVTSQDCTTPNHQTWTWLYSRLARYLTMLGWSRLEWPIEFNVTAILFSSPNIITNSPDSRLYCSGRYSVKCYAKRSSLTGLGQNIFIETRGFRACMQFISYPNFHRLKTNGKCLTLVRQFHKKICHSDEIYSSHWSQLLLNSVIANLSCPPYLHGGTILPLYGDMLVWSGETEQGVINDRSSNFLESTALHWQKWDAD